MLSNFIEIISVSCFTKLKSYVISFKVTGLDISLTFLFLIFLRREIRCCSKARTVGFMERKTALS